jgi:hypothetical protein
MKSNPSWILILTKKEEENALTKHNWFSRKRIRTSSCE